MIGAPDSSYLASKTRLAGEENHDPIAGRGRHRANDTVVAYYFKGEPQRVGPTSVSGNTLSFGSGYSVRMTLTGKNTASASYSSFGRKNTAKLRRN